MQWYAWLGVAVVGWLAAWVAIAVTMASGVVDPAGLATWAVRHACNRPGDRRD